MEELKLYTVDICTGSWHNKTKTYYFEFKIKRTKVRSTESYSSWDGALNAGKRFVRNLGYDYAIDQGSNIIYRKLFTKRGL